MNFNYYIPTRILFGAGQLSKLHKYLNKGEKALIVTTAGTSVKKYGYLQRLEEQLDTAGVPYVVFDKILPNPVKTHVMEGARLAKEQGCKVVIGLGGGSPIDSAKSIAVMAANDGDYWDYIDAGTGKGKAVPNKPLPVIAITTTAGTGTEADPWTVITNEETHEKIGYGYDDTFPALAIVDPELMLTVPADLTAYQGFDALFHSTEGYLNRDANIMSDLFALKAIELLAKYLPTAVSDPANLEARTNVALANTLAGMVESTSGCISEHSLEHALSAYYPKLAHGAGLIIISEAYFTHFAKTGAVDQRMIDMARAMGVPSAGSPMDFVEALVKLQKDCGVYGMKLSEYGIQPSEFGKFNENARSAMGGLFKADPVPLSDADVIDIYTQSYR